jgi:CRISPR-associated endonuclease/helicase Cas3
VAVGLEEGFQSLTGHSPMRWQRRLYDCFISGNLPDICGIPTGFGKTSVIVIWLIALANRPVAYPPVMTVWTKTRRPAVRKNSSALFSRR